MIAPFTLVQLTLPGYRREFLRCLRTLQPLGIIACGDEQFEPTVRLGIERLPQDIELRNRFFFRRRFAYQVGYRRAVLRSQVWIIELNPRIINSWLALVEGRIRGRQCVLWGHFTGRRDTNQPPGLGRRLMVRLGGSVLAYTVPEAERFRRAFPGAKVYAAPNAVDGVGALTSRADGDRGSFLYVGRLVEEKGVELIVEAFRKAVIDRLVPHDAELVLVGAGPLEPRLRQLSAVWRADCRIEVVGETFNPSELNMRYDRAVATVCGGYIGLNLTQSLVRGVPMVFPGNAPHAPEIDLAVPNWNCVIAEGPPSAGSLASALGRMWRWTESGLVDYDSIQRAASSIYNAEAMAEGFVRAIRGS